MNEDHWQVKTNVIDNSLYSLNNNPKDAKNILLY